MPSSLIDRPHPIGVAAGEVVVDGRQVASPAQQAVQVHRQRGGQRLSFARLHLDDRAVEHGDAAEQLHVEVPHVDGAARGLADQGIALDQQPRQRFAALARYRSERLRLRSCASASFCNSGSRAAILGTSAAHRASRQAFMPPARLAHCVVMPLGRSLIWSCLTAHPATDSRADNASHPL